MPSFLRFGIVAVLLVAVACGAQPERDAASSGASDAATQAVEPALFPVEQDGRWGYIDRTGALAIAPQFERAWRFTDGRALVRQDGRFGFIDTTGTVVIEPRFADAWHFSEGLAPVQEDSLWGFVDRDGAMVVDPQFDLAPGVVEEGPTPSASDVERVRVDGRYGYRTDDGTVVVEPQYEQAWHFSDGLARVKKDGLWGYVDRSGAVAIDPQFVQAWDFRNGLARVRTPNGTRGYINRTGTLVWP